MIWLTRGTSGDDSQPKTSRTAGRACKSKQRWRNRQQVFAEDIKTTRRSLRSQIILHLLLSPSLGDKDRRAGYRMTSSRLKVASRFETALEYYWKMTREYFRMTAQLVSITVTMQQLYRSVVWSHWKMHSGRFWNECIVLQLRQHYQTFAIHLCTLITHKACACWGDNWHARRVLNISHCCTLVTSRIAAG